MRTSQALIATLKETPADAEVISHQLMLRAGLVKKLASGLYTWLPFGLRVLRKVENIIREEMNKNNAHELLMPIVQPAELWQESGRWQQYGGELLRIKDRHDRDFCLGPTHEEVISDMVRSTVNSYKQLPVNFYQIQTKFRDERRPRFGIMRAREFLMKDAYSFHSSQSSLQETYDNMYQCYSSIFERIGLDYRAVIADTGSIGGNASHEFHVLANSGEDRIAFSTESDFAANIEMAEALAIEPSFEPPKNREKIPTPNIKSIETVCAFLDVPAKHTLKTLIVKGDSEENPLIALVLRGDHQLNDIKAEKAAGVLAPLEMANEKDIVATLHCEPGYLGIVDLNIPMIVDRSAAVMRNFTCGANEKEYHFINANWPNNEPPSRVEDIRNIVKGDPSPDGKGCVDIAKGIEVGHIFQLGSKYSDALNVNYLDENGKEQACLMGCYGIGVSRVVAATIEQNHDDKGIIWPDAIAPFELVLIPLNFNKSDLVRDYTEALYNDLKALDIDVLFDDRNERPGVKFADAELIGIPHQLIIGERSLKEDQVEYQSRKDGIKTSISKDEALAFLKTTLQ